MPTVGLPMAKTRVRLPALTLSATGPMTIGPVVPVGTMSTAYVLAGTSTVSTSELATLRSSGLPSTRMSAGGTCAVWATARRVFPRPTGDRLFGKAVSTGSASRAAGR